MAVSKFEVDGGIEETHGRGEVEIARSLQREWARLEETAANVLLFEEDRWTAPRLPRKVTFSPALQGVRGLTTPPAVKPVLHAVGITV